MGGEGHGPPTGWLDRGRWRPSKPVVGCGDDACCLHRNRLGNRILHEVGGEWCRVLRGRTLLGGGRGPPPATGECLRDLPWGPSLWACCWSGSHGEWYAQQAPRRSGRVDRVE